MKTALLLYPHQLYKIEHLPEVDTVIMVEDPIYFGVDQQYPINLHKQKIILHRASMRRYVEEVLWPNDINVDYVDLDVFMQSGDVLDRAAKFEKVYVFNAVDDLLTKRLLQARREREGSIDLIFIDSPNFYLKDNEIRNYMTSKSKHLFSDFYQWQRERFNILIDNDYKPVGDSLIIKEQSHLRLPKDQPLPSFEVFGDNKYVKDAITFVREHFPNNPGSTDFIYPTSHEEAEKWLYDFVQHRLDNFSQFQEAIDKDAPWAFHSVLSASLNIGLLDPRQVVDAVLARNEKSPVSLTSLEGFIRQILGHREYTRGQYVANHVAMRSNNVFGHQRRLTSAWYDGTLGIPPYDNMVKRLDQHAYAHQAERLMVAGNLLLLCEINPDDIYRWFKELFVDAYDWIMVPNVYGMSQLSNKDSMGTKPCISSSDYIMEISSYEKGQWNDVWDGLYWRFIEKHQTALSKNPHMSTVVAQLSKLNPDRKRIIGYHAEDFLKQFTTL